MTDALSMQALAVTKTAIAIVIGAVSIYDLTQIPQGNGMPRENYAVLVLTGSLTISGLAYLLGELTRAIFWAAMGVFWFIVLWKRFGPPGFFRDLRQLFTRGSV
ncbi:hypothetical protein DEQ92_20340 [Haloferax sp. Atlit-6N]|uniref:hypothetical protein n=1 Tax=Haloferax sp. Atlit-6N TaxID=2077205 RepID=UPI000E28081A|nr:hypothetical protein [Haloferax sp. Atlit-6N]REA00205.1 hypothetical protein DEQ92_20340 [Haloferax sp. Atlit-6N]